MKTQQTSNTKKQAVNQRPKSTRTNTKSTRTQKPKPTLGQWNDNLWLVVNNDTDAVLGLSANKIDSETNRSYDVDPDIRLFIDVLTAYCPKQTITLDDIDWFMTLTLRRQNKGWKLMPAQ